MIIKRIIALVFTCLICANGLLAQAPKYSNEFLAIGVGARALAMSNAYVAHANDVTAGYWNPAGLLNVQSKVQVGLMHAEYFAGIAKYDYIGASTSIDPSSRLGLSIIRFGVDDIPNTTQLIDANGNFDYDKVTSFSAADYAFVFSYAKKPKIEGLTYGANAKIIHRKVGSFASAWGFGLDAGLQYSRGTWKFALMGRDITSTFNGWKFTLDENTQEVFEQTGNEIPDDPLEITLPQLVLGAGKMFKLSEKFSLYTEIDFDMTFDGKRNVLIKGDPMSIEPHFGFEFAYSNFIFLRGGVTNIQQETSNDVADKTVYTVQPNIGIGLRIKSFTLDYALTDIGNSSVALYSNIFSLKFDINKREK